MKILVNTFKDFDFSNVLIFKLKNWTIVLKPEKTYVFTKLTIKFLEKMYKIK